MGLLQSMIVLQNTRQSLLSCNVNNLTKQCVRYASKKGSTSTRNKGGHPKPKHRGWKFSDGATVTEGSMLVLQRKTRFHPGLNVGFGRNGTLFAIEPGKVMVTCEKVNLNWDHTWIKGNYSGREGTVIYKKHYNVIPKPQHTCFSLIETV